MKSLLQWSLALGLITGSLAVTVEEANAVVCARGVYRAGCVGPHGAVGVRRAPIAVVRRPVAVRRRVW
ncbi:hypothetical protein [uncultured Rhodoblastus sp.]|uniref:hypothetical protein n=1 Tax=uncultured Rhodoblastus sp. TaxID=543037 RepID=UPI0025EB94B1|nr:hypothetical protein [uncultured Rhodoblastus sp.]